jgi:hypothetical protein
MKSKRFMAAFLAVLIILAGILPAYALADYGYIPPTPTPTPVPTPTPTPTPVPTPTPTPPPTPSPKPFTPDGTATVVDNVTESDGKEFYTFTTEAGNEFFLVIDNQKEDKNVYFLNAVTEDDLKALAVKTEDAEDVAIPVPATPVPTPIPEPSASPGPEAEEQEPSGGGSFLFLFLVVAAAGGAGYYFKIYKPKQQPPDEEDEDYEDIPDPEPADEDGDVFGDEPEGHRRE